MTDYLEEHLGNAEALLERIRQLKQEASGLTSKTALKENVDEIDGLFQDTQYTEEKSDIVSKNRMTVYDLGMEINHTNETVDKLDVDLEMREKDQDVSVNYRAKKDNNSQDLEQTGTTCGKEEPQTNARRAESRSPLSVQLEELDRAVSALTSLSPGRRETAQSGYPISLAGPQSLPAGSNITGGQDEAWNGPGAAADAGFVCGGRQSWAEQADRMFRRDSRRYDGGFYLY